MQFLFVLCITITKELMTTKNKIAQATIKIQDETIKALLKDIKFYDKLLNNVFNSIRIITDQQKKNTEDVFIARIALFWL